MGAILGAGAIAGLGGIGGSLIGGHFANQAAKKQANAIREATAEQRRQYNENVTRLAPYTQFGGEQLNALSGWLKDPSKQPMNYLDPGYEFRREEGMKGLTGNAATSGLLQSGDTLRAATRYGQNLASSEYGNAFNRWLGEGGFRQGLAGMGQSAAANLGYLGNQNANAISNLLSARGSAEAGGDRAVGKSISDTLTGLGGLGGNTLAKYLEAQKNNPDNGMWEFADPNAGWSGLGGRLQDRNAMFQVPGGSNPLFADQDAGYLIGDEQG